MEPRLEVIEYLFRYYGCGESRALAPSHNLVCPICGGAFEETVDGRDFSEDYDNDSHPINDITDPIDIINYIHGTEAAIADEVIFNSAHIGDIMLQCLTKGCNAEVFFEETTLKVIKGTENISKYMKAAYGSSTVSTGGHSAGLDGFFKH